AIGCSVLLLLFGAVPWGSSLEPRPGALPLVAPMMLAEVLSRGAVLVVELAVLAVLVARVVGRGTRAEEGVDRTAPRRAGRRVGGAAVRVERPTRDGAHDVAVHFAGDARTNGVAVVGALVARTRTLAGHRHERAAVTPREPEAAILVPLDLEIALDRVSRPRVAAGAVVRADHGDRRCLPVLGRRLRRF